MKKTAEKAHEFLDFARNYSWTVSSHNAEQIFLSPAEL